VEFWKTLGDHLWYERTPFLILAYLVVAAFVKRSPLVERYHMRVARILVLGHLVSVPIAAIQDWLGYDGETADTIGMAFMLLGTMSLGLTLVFRIVMPRLGLDMPRILVDLLTFFGFLVALIIVGQRAGFSIAGLITTSAVLTAVIGLALQDTLGNVMGGISVQLDKSIKVGDWISLGPGQPQGKIVEIRWRYTAIETRAWDTIIIPNGFLVKNQITIMGRRKGEPLHARRTLDFFVDYKVPPNDVITAVEAALRRDPIPVMAATPAPHCLFHGMRDSFGYYIVRYWLTELDRDDPPDSAVRTRIWYALHRAGIPLAIPNSNIYLTHETEERATKLADHEHAKRLAALASVDLFRGLPENLRHELADHIKYARFARGEAITREGERDDGLYMVVEGDLSVRIGKGADEHEVARLQAGQFFGEMSLMTGEARTASVVAVTDVVAYRCDKPALEAALQAMPALADQIAETLAVRKTALSAAQGERDETKKARVEDAKKDLLGRIRGFFKILDKVA
jgi:small-conductance mechanosensitive channel/CRP-like cAMP-binding protein